MITATQSSLKAKLDTAAFDMNMCLHNVTDKDVLERFSEALSEYHDAKGKMEILDNLKNHLKSLEENNETETNDINDRGQ